MITSDCNGVRLSPNRACLLTSQLNLPLNPPLNPPIAEQHSNPAAEKIPLTTSEFDLLVLLANHPEQILSRDYIYKTLRGIEYDGMDRAIDTKVANLRKKLADNASLSTRIITVRGQGYLFVPDSWG